MNQTDSYDMKITVGEENDVKTFEAHSVILKARSSYFRTALSNNWVNKSEEHNGNLKCYINFFYCAM